MPENFERFNPWSEGDKTPEKPEIEPISGQVEMPDDLVEPEGNSGKWKTITGEVEIEGKKVEVSYREKVIELPKHRQEETGIKRIRRRELLPPFPKGLYLSVNERREQILEEQVKKPFPDKIKQEEQIKRIKEHEPFPVYHIDERFDDFYRFLTDGKYPDPTDRYFIHIMEYGITIPNRRINPAKKEYLEKHEQNLELFKNEGLYLQEIYSGGAGKHKTNTGGGDTGKLWVTVNGRPWQPHFATPIFIFSLNNKRSKEYFDFIGRNPRNPRYRTAIADDIPIIQDPSQKSLRWCHAELAIIPTKRSLNVLFFETDDEKKS